MKIRKGFVSNSSSSSFIIDRKYISDYQMELIENHIEHSIELGMYEYNDWYWNQSYNKDEYTEEEKRQKDLERYKSDAWHIHKKDNEIEFYTSMDNFSMETFLDKIGVPTDKIRDRDC